MFKVELCFDTDNLEQDALDDMCMETDAIFERENLDCSERQPGRRVYLDRGRKQDYGRFWAAIFGLKRNAAIVSHLKECFWYNGSNRENLLTDFLRS